MSTLDVLVAIQSSALSHALRKSNHLVGAALQIVHVLGVILLLSSLVLVSLRLFQISLAKQDLRDITRGASRLLWLGLAFAVISGVLMFISSPRLYYYNKAFDLKMILLALAVLVQITLQRTLVRAEPAPGLARASVVLALLCWFGVGLAGRIIGFI